MAKLDEPRRTLIVTGFALALIPTLFARGAEHWFSIRGRPEFADVQAQLQVVVDEHARHARNRFCVIGERAGSFVEAWVYWPEDGKLILWRPDRDNPHSIVGSNRYLDLMRDVVSGDDAGGSTYKLTRATADGIVRACARQGNEYVVQARPENAGHG